MSEESDRGGSNAADQRRDLDAFDVDSHAGGGDLDDLFTEVDVSEFADGTRDAYVASGEGAEGVIVDKTTYCQRCEHFSAPPGVACHDPGSEIVEQVDVDHFRVSDCPVVEQRAGEVDILEEIDLHSDLDGGGDADVDPDADADIETDEDDEDGSENETDTGTDTGIDTGTDTGIDPDTDPDSGPGSDADVDVDGRSGNQD